LAIIFTSVFWIPLLILALTFYVALEVFRFIQLHMEDWRLRARKMWIKHVASFFSGRKEASAREERLQRKQREAAIQDRRFLRGIFESLPGVDSERALRQAENLQRAASDQDPLSRKYTSLIY